MKKLLSIIASLGLVSSITPVAVSCQTQPNNSNPSNKISIAGIESKIEIFAGMKNSEVKTEILTQIRSLFPKEIREKITEKDFFFNINLEKNDEEIALSLQKLVVNSTENSKYIKDSFTLKIQKEEEKQKVSLSKLESKVNNIIEGMKNSEVKTEILIQIKNLFDEQIREKITENDFTVNFENDEQIVKPRQNLIVEANLDSEYLKDSFEFNVQAEIEIKIEDVDKNEIATYEYQTDFETLGEVILQDYDHYLVRDFGGSLGFFLYGVNYYYSDGKKATILADPGVNGSPNTGTYWALYYVSNGQEVYSPVGMSSFYFENLSQEVIWRVTELW